MEAVGHEAYEQANFAFALWACAVRWLAARLVIVYGRLQAAFAAASE
jgi:hypothetical protein